MEASLRSFSSGWLPLESDDGSISIPISINGQACRDTLIVVDASPIPPDAVLEYRLADDSSYLHGCFDPCDCPLEEPRPLGGTLSLVEILNHGTYVEYAVPKAAFVAPAVDPAGNEVILNGFGLYTLIQGFAGPAHILDLRLRSNDGPVEEFSSELFNTDPTFPARVCCRRRQERPYLSRHSPLPARGLVGVDRLQGWIRVRQHFRLVDIPPP